MELNCMVTGCKYHDGYECTAYEVVISDNELTAAGFIPQCTNYEEGEYDNGAEY